MTTRFHFATPLAIALAGFALLVSAPVWAQNTFSYNYGVGTFTLNGQFTTNASSGLITEADVLSNSYTVFNSGVAQYSITFPGGTTNTGTLTNFTGVGATSGSYTGVDDFAYNIGSSQFSQTNPAKIDPLFPLDLTLLVAPNTYYGLAYSTPLNLFSLDENSNVVTAGPQGTTGFASGPTITPEPGSLALLVGMSLTGAGFLSRRRRK